MNILVIDDEPSMRHMLTLLLKKEGYHVDAVEDGEKALDALREKDYDFILCDIRMPGIDGMEFLKRLKTQDARHKTKDSKLESQVLSLKSQVSSLESVVIMMSAYGTIDTAIECIKLGAYDYISKPFRKDEILFTLKKAEERERLKKENIKLKEEVRREYSFENIVAKSPQMMEIFRIIKKIADYDSTVLITGESGTGKELVARALHYNSLRKAHPFVPVNCGAIPNSLLESELFGHIKGAFTDAVKDKRGLFEEADKGTIFLDEIGELPKELQVKLLRVLQEGEIRRLGDTKSIKVDTRVTAATAKDLSEEVENGGFREDLYYRLKVIPIYIPPLRERREDIPILAGHFLKKFNEKTGKGIKGFDSKVMKHLLEHPWAGNVRELENAIERAVILADGDTITIESLSFIGEKTQSTQRLKTQDFHTLSIKKAQDALEQEFIKTALLKTKGNKSRAAKLLEISYRALLYKLKEYGME